jgi:hypothetical protein
MPRDFEPLVDSTLDRELEALLAVEPSPELSARVIAAVAVECQRWALSWLIAPAGALAAAVLVVAVVTQVRSTGPTTPALTGRLLVSPLAHAPQVTAMPMTSTGRVTVSTGSRRRTARYVRLQARRRPTELVVLIAPDESRALGQFLARTRPLQVASATDDSPLPLSADALAPVRPLHVPLLVIEPLPSSDDLPGGVRP